MERASAFDAPETVRDIYAWQAREFLAEFEAARAEARRRGLVETISGPLWEPKIRRFLACGFTRMEAREALAEWEVSRAARRQGKGAERE